MGVSDYLLKLLAKFKPFQIQIKPTINIGSLNIGGNNYKVEKGELIVDLGGTEARIRLVKDDKGVVRPVINDVQLEGLPDRKDDSVKFLDEEEKVFTRADIGAPQLELLRPGNPHEPLIKKLKPYLDRHLGGRDLGAVFAASAIVRTEDEAKDKDITVRLHESFISAYSGRGAMIYNLLRSNILADEILHTLNTLNRTLKDFTKTRQQFLQRWDSYIERGYPTAHFVNREDTIETLRREIDRRFEDDATNVRIFSRTEIRNRYVETWIREIVALRGFKIQQIRRYKLGFSRAVMIDVGRPKRPL